MKKRPVIALIVAALLATSCGKKQTSAGAGSGSSTAGSEGAASTAGDDPAHKAVTAASAEAAALLGPNGKTLVGQLIDAAATAHRAVSRDAWDPAAVIAAVGKDRAALFAWVRDRTALVPYRGSLRGPVGVMMDRVGNSLDRSLLLGELLHQAGLEVRLANAPLDPGLVDKLVASHRTRARPALPTATLDETALAAAIAQLLGIDQAALQAGLAKQQAALAALATQTRARVAQQSQALAALVPATGAPAGDADAFADHWWIQVRDGELWSDLDPALPTAAPGEALAASPADTLAPADLADDRRHMLTVRVIGEVWHDDAREEAVLLEHTFAPSQFYGQRIVVQNLPLDMPDDRTLFAAGDPASIMRKALLDQTEFAPILHVGASIVAGSSVNDRGELLSLTAGDGNTIRLARAVQHATRDGVGGATDLLGALPGSDSAAGSATPRALRQAFTAEWLEIEVRAPGMPSRVVRRTIFDTIGPVADRAAAPRAALAQPARLDRAFALLGETELLPLFAQIPAAFVENRTINALVAARDVIVAVATHQDLGALGEKLATLAPIPGPLYALATSRFSLDPQIYLDRLNVLAMRDRLVAKGSAVAMRRDVDILANGVAVWPGAKDARASRIAQGVADTALEAVTISCGSAMGCTRTPSTSELYAATSGKGWAVVAVPQGPAAADRDAGYAIVAFGSTPSSWWRIDPATGETLGMNPSGGDAATEYVMQQRALIANFLLGVNSLMRCVYGVATATSGGTDRLVSGGRCVAAATLGFAAGHFGILLGGTGGLVLGVLLQGIGTWVG